MLATQISWTDDGCGDHMPQENLARYSLRNLSRHRSPIQIAGYVTFQDNPAENYRSYWVHASAKNTSKKGIAARSASLETAGGSGPKLDFNELHDFFFTGDVLAPSEVDGLPTESCPIRLVLKVSNGNPYTETPDATAPSTTAFVRVKFVQFTDGSIWGDQDEAAKLQGERRETLQKIKSLQQIYSEQGERAFMDALAEATSLPCFERIKALCRKENADSTCARKALEDMLAIAERQRRLNAH
jgi:hypothetical protein